MFRKLFAMIFVTVLVGSVVLMVRNGVFKSPEFSQGTAGPFLLLWKENIGPYHKILPSMTAVESWARANQLSCTETFGEYIDDPNIVEHERLRSHVGCVIDRRPDIALPEDLKLEEKSARDFVIGIFNGSPALGPWKVYGAAGEFMRERDLQEDGPVMEFYRPLADEGFETRYLFPIRSAKAK